MSQMNRRHADETGTEAALDLIRQTLPTAKRNDRGEVVLQAADLQQPGWWLEVFGADLAADLLGAGILARYTDSSAGPLLVVRA